MCVIACGFLSVTPPLLCQCNAIQVCLLVDTTVHTDLTFYKRLDIFGGSLRTLLLYARPLSKLPKKPQSDRKSHNFKLCEVDSLG